MSKQAWGGALLALGGLTGLAGVEAHDRSSNPEPLVNVGTVVGAASVATGLFLVTRPSGHNRSRSSTVGGMATHNRRSRYRGH